MIKRCIGIEIGSSYLRAVQISRTGEQFQIEKVFSSQMRRSTDSLQEILRSLTERLGFDRRAEVAISMSPDEVFFKNLETDFATVEQSQAQGLSALEHNFPIQPDEIVAAVCSYRRLPGEKCSVLATAAVRTSLQEKLQILSSAKMHPSTVEAAIFAIHATVAVNHPEILTGRTIIAYVDERYLTLIVTQDNNILIVRNIPLAAGSDSNGKSPDEQAGEMLWSEAQMTWRKIFGTEIEQETKIYLITAGDCECLQPLIEEDLHCQTTIVDPYARVKTPADHKADFPIHVAEGLALRVLAPEQTQGVNFLAVDTKNIKPKLNLRKQLVTCAALIGAIAVFWLIGLFVRQSYLEANYTRIKNQIRDVFQSALPDEKNIVSPLVQLEQKLGSFRKDYQLFGSFCPGASGPLEILRNISANIPSQGNLKVNDLLIAADSVRISGSCDSFESVYQWQQHLQGLPGFKVVDMQDVQKEPKSGAVRFTMLLSSATSPALTEQK